MNIRSNKHEAKDMKDLIYLWERLLKRDKGFKCKQELISNLLKEFDGARLVGGSNIERELNVNMDSEDIDILFEDPKKHIIFARELAKLWKRVNSSTIVPTWRKVETHEGYYWVVWEDEYIEEFVYLDKIKYKGWVIDFHLAEKILDLQEQIEMHIKKHPHRAAIQYCKGDTFVPFCLS